ncbi:hypothetical protein Tco_0562162 [Tanacetum coccineum]
MKGAATGLAAGTIWGTIVLSVNTFDELWNDGITFSKHRPFGFQPIPLALPVTSTAQVLRSGMRFKMLKLRKYNMHNMGKTIGKLHALLIEYEKGLPKKVATPQVMAIRGGRIHKANKKSLNAKGNGKGKGKGKDKPVYIPKPKNHKPSTKEHPTKCGKLEWGVE